MKKARKSPSLFWWAICASAIVLTSPLPLEKGAKNGSSTNPLLNTPRHPENFHFRALHSAVVLHENSWGSSYYQGVMDPLNRPIDKAVWGNPRFWVSGRLPHFCMISLRFPIAPKMQKFAMTRFLTTMSGIARHRSVFSSHLYLSVFPFSDACNKSPIG